MRIFSIQGFRFFDSSIDIVLIFEFNHDLTIMKMTIFEKSITCILKMNQHYILTIDYNSALNISIRCNHSVPVYF